MRAAPVEPKFMADHMLAGLGRLLRTLGYDTAWAPGLRTHELIAIANAEGRVFLTRSGRLDQYPAAARLLSLPESDVAGQLQRVVRELGLDIRAGLFTRCLLCNAPLESVVEKETVRPLVHPNVFARYETFWRCPRCGRAFWHGSHTRNMFAMLKNILSPTVSSSEQ